MVLNIDDYQDLLALNRALMEVRYLANDVDDATRGSAPLSHLHMRVVDELKRTLRSSGQNGEVARWEQWQLLQNREIEMPRILDYLSRNWPRLPATLKREVLANQLRPFVFDEDDIQRLISTLDQRTTE